MKRFECTMCGACCSNLGSDRVVLLLRQDIEKIAEKLDVSAADVERNYCEINRAFSEEAGRPILQLRSMNTDCIFLSPEKKCLVQSHKPFQCRHGPENFLQGPMGEDYECMKDLDVSEETDQAPTFFNLLLSGV